MNWKLSKIVRNKTYKVNDVNLFDLEWKKEGEVELKDVATGMRKMFDICTVDINSEEFKFAVCEIANNVYCFYVAA